MRVSRQIGWSNKSNILYEMLGELYLLRGQFPSSTTSTSTSTTSTTTTSNLSGVTIGTQIWSLKNLDVATYRNGDPIPEVTDPAVWQSLTTGAWCWYNNDPANGPIYGKLYNWYAVNDPRGLAPLGWHVPTDAEFSTLSTFLGGDLVAGGALKSITGWNSPNTGATNSSGFTALPGGVRSFSVFSGIGNNGYFWSSTESTATSARRRFLSNSGSNISSSTTNKLLGNSVRLVKD